MSFKAVNDLIIVDVSKTLMLLKNSHLLSSSCTNNVSNMGKTVSVCATLPSACIT